MNLVDEDGEAITDYFDTTGDLIYTDGIDNGIIRIAAVEDVSFAKDLPSVDATNSCLYSQSISLNYAFRMGVIDQSSALKVYEHYNKTGLPLVVNGEIDGSFEFSNNTPDRHLIISVNIRKNLVPNKDGYTLDNYHDIHNALNIHEGQGHYKLYKELGPYRYSTIPKSKREIKAIIIQMSDPSWEQTTPGFQSGVKKYYQQNKNHEQ